MIATAELIQKPTFDEISLQAYLLWEQEGSPHGRHEEFWFKAEEILSQRIEQEKTRIESEAREVKVKASRRTSPTTIEPEEITAPKTPKSKTATSTAKTRKKTTTKTSAAKATKTSDKTTVKTKAATKKTTPTKAATKSKTTSPKAKAKTSKSKATK